MFCWPVRCSAGWSNVLLASQMFCWLVKCSAGQSDVLLASQMFCWPVRCSAGQSNVLLASQMFHIWRTPKFHNFVYSSTPLAPILSQMNPLHPHLSCFSKINCEILHLRQGLPSGLFTLGFPTEHCTHLFSVVRATCLILLGFTAVIIFGDMYHVSSMKIRSVHGDMYHVSSMKIRSVQLFPENFRTNLSVICNKI